MKIVMMTPWNVACGVSIHAELIGREWVKAGHELKVFAPQEEDKLPTARDEPYASRCYSRGKDFQGGLKELWLDSKPLLESDYQFFVAQNLELLPVRELAEIFLQITGKAKTILVIHEGNKSCLASSEYQAFNWDAVVCFDERYRKEFSKVFPIESIRLIPYPAHPKLLGDKEEARKKLGLPLDGRIILTYGISMQQHLPVFLAIERLNKAFPLKYLLLVHETPAQILNQVKAKYDFVEVREGAHSIEELYRYLHAADVLLLHKQSAGLVVSSSVYLCLGSGCPIAIFEGRYTEDLGEEVFKYKNLNELQGVLALIFEEERPSQEAIDKFLTEKAASKVASSFIELFSSWG